MDADAIVNNWVSTKKANSSSSQSSNQADDIVNRFFAKQSGATPNPFDDSAVSHAINKIGSQDYNDLCERFAEQAVYGRNGIYPSAIDAWSDYSKQGKTYVGHDAPAGSLIYFGADDSNGGDGHVAVSDGKGNIIGATSNGVKMLPLSSWTKQTKQKVLGYVIP